MQMFGTFLRHPVLGRITSFVRPPVCLFVFLSVYVSTLKLKEVGRVHLCRVAANTVWSHMAFDAP